MLQRALVLALSVTLCADLSAGCFPAPKLARDVGANASKPDSLGDTGADSEDALGADSPEVDSDAPTDAANGCEKNEDCARFAAPPCVSSVCDGRACRTEFTGVSCDDGDPCTTEDHCVQGMCGGRPYTASEARNWSTILAPTGDAPYADLSDIAVGPGGAIDVLGRAVGRVPWGDGNTFDATADHPNFAARLSASGVVTSMHQLTLSEQHDAVLIPHALQSDRGDIVLLGLYDDAADPQSSVVQRVSSSGAPVWAPGRELPGLVFSVVPVSRLESLVFGSFAGEVDFAMNDGTSQHVAARGDSDLYVAKINDDREIVRLTIVSSEGRDTAGSIVRDGDQVLWLPGFEGTHLQIGAIDVVLAAGEHAPRCRVDSDGEVTADTRSIASDAGSFLGGFAASNGEIVGSAVWLADASWRIGVVRFAFGAESASWSHVFIDSPQALALMFWGGPMVYPLPNDGALLVWSVPDGTAMGGWPAPQSGEVGKTLFATIRANGSVAKTWQLSGYVTTELDPKRYGGKTMLGSRVAASPDGGVVAALTYYNVDLGPDFGGQSAQNFDGVILKYSPAHVWGCATTP